jgi:hypothetical protein
MMPNARPHRRPPRWLSALVVLAGGAVALLALFFFVLNDAWVPVLVPRPPWSAGPAFAAYEAHFAALVLVPLAIGAAAATAVCRRAGARSRRRAGEDRDRAARLEVEIEKVSRLLSSSRGGDRATP